MAELNEELLEGKCINRFNYQFDMNNYYLKDALNLISNSEASKSNKNEFPEKNQN